MANFPDFTLYPFGIMVNSLDMSQKGFWIVKQLNETVDQDCRFSPIVFYQEYAKSVDVNRFCCLLDKEVWSYDGVVIATSLETAETLLNCPCPVKKFFYIWHLEWIYDDYNYSYLQSIYQNDNLELIARNEDHAQLIEKYWKKPAFVMEDFDRQVLQQIVKNESKNESENESEKDNTND